MPVMAYVFIETTPGKAAHVADGVGKLPGVKLAHPVSGSYDVIMFLEAEDVATLGEMISTRVHRIPGVLKTITNVVMG